MADVLLPDSSANGSPPEGPGRRPGSNGAAPEASTTPAERSSAEVAGLPGPPAGEARAEAAPPVDVWSRRERRYRVRAILLLLLNLLLFSGLCVFMHWLHVARPFDFSADSYLAPLKFLGEQTQNLNDFVLYPISVEQTPMHGVVLGLLVASIVAVPISVALLYGFPYALPFVAAVLVFAHMPWMAVTLLGSCIIAALPPFRLSFRFGAGLAGMLPVIVYLILATRGTPQQIGTYSSPDQKLLLAAPWVLAVLAAAVMLGAILIIARVVKYRPGAVAPVIAVMFATPAVIFARHVGFDEVSYRVLESEYGPRAARFGARDLRSDVLNLLGNDLDESTRNQLLGIFAGETEPLLELQRRVATRVLRRLMADRRAAYDAVRRFIADHPSSRYVPCALYIQAWALDTRLDERNAPHPAALRRELYTDYPHVQSEAPWAALLKNYSDSPLALAARLRLAQLHLRRGEIEPARQLLTELLERASARAPASAPRGGRGTLLGRVTAPEASLGFDPDPYIREAHRLHELVSANSHDARYGAAPLQELARLDPRRPQYAERLAELAARYPDALLHDNLMVAWAVSLPDREQRLARLTQCLADYADGDAACEALFRLGELEVQGRGDSPDARRNEGLARWREAAARCGESYWGREAAERLRGIALRSDLPTGDTVAP